MTGKNKAIDNWGALGTNENGVLGSSISSTGVRGASATSIGVRGTGSKGVQGESDTGTGVYGLASDSGAVMNHGGHFEAAGQSGIGVVGAATSSGTATNDGGFFEASSRSGRGVYGRASYVNTPGSLINHYGGYFSAPGTAGIGAHGENTGSGNIGQLGANGSGVYGQAAASASIGVVGQNSNKYGYLGGSDFGVKSLGDLVVNDGAFRGNIGPNNGAPFPRPALDSGWKTLAPGESQTLTHSLGGNADNYVVDMQSRYIDIGSRNNTGHGGDWWTAVLETGFYWFGLDTTSIIMYRGVSDLGGSNKQYRIRIWVYK